MSESKTPKPTLSEQKDISRLNILQLVSLLKPGQVWAILAVIFAVLSGTFGLGYKFSTLVAETEVVRYKTENISLHEKIKEFRAIQTKERFLALYLRYLIATDVYSVEESEKNRQAIEDAGYYLRSYIEELLTRGEEASEEIDLRGLFLGKGGGRNATVKFGYDGSIWPVPPEFGFAARG